MQNICDHVIKNKRTCRWQRYTYGSIIFKLAEQLKITNIYKMRWGIIELLVAKITGIYEKEIK